MTNSEKVKDLERRIEALNKTLGTLITWLHLQLGTAAMEELLEMLDRVKK